MPDTSEQTSERRPFEPADVCRLRSVSDVAMHPSDNETVVVIRWADLESDSNRAGLHAVANDGSRRRQLTEGHADSLPTFSPDGSRLAFSRATPKEPGRLMMLDWATGEISEICQFEDGGPMQIRWVDDQRLAAIAPQRPEAQDGVDDDELRRRPRISSSTRYRFNARGFIDDRAIQLWLIDLNDDDVQPTAIGQPGLDHGTFAVAPDGGSIAISAFSDPDADLTGLNRLWLYSLDGSDPMLLTGSPGEWSDLAWHDDGTLWVSGSVDAMDTRFYQFHQVDVSGAGAPRLVAQHDLNIINASSGGGGFVAVAGAFLALGIRRGRVGIDRHELSDGARSVLFEEDSQVLAFDASADGSVIMAAITSCTRPAELWRIEGAEATKILSLNDDVLDQLDLVGIETVTVTSADGSEVEVFVTRPPESVKAAGAVGPGLVYVHGGPMTQYGYGFFDEFQVAAATGYVVVGGNPRGSDGYGEDWARAITGGFGERDWEDVQAITDYLAEQPDVDADRLGIGGGSYGGFMTAWALAHDKAGRYKAGLVERSVVSWYSMYGTSDIGNWFTSRVIGATIEDDLEGVFRQSPLSYAASITAPTLIVHSEEDWRCSIEQAEQLFTAIRRNGGDATLVRFPGENHELSRSGQPKHRLERFEIIHEFFAAHLGGADYNTGHIGPIYGAIDSA